MIRHDKPSMVEKISGNLIAEGAMATIGAFASFPLAPLLPVLSNSLANRRHRSRVEKALTEINRVLKEHEEKLKNLSDSQFKIINEAILTILQTTEDKKIEYLKLAIENNIEDEKVDLTFACEMSRILRDISADEIAFLVKNAHYSKIVFQDSTVGSDLYVKPNSNEIMLVSGLISLGLIIPGTPTIDNISAYQFSPLVQKLLKVLDINQRRQE